MTIKAPGTLAELKGIADPSARSIAAKAYIEQRFEAIEEAYRIRDDAIGLMLDHHGPAAVAVMSGMSLSHVKNVQRWRS